VLRAGFGIMADEPGVAWSPSWPATTNANPVSQTGALDVVALYSAQRWFSLAPSANQPRLSNALSEATTSICNNRWAMAW